MIALKRSSEILWFLIVPTMLLIGGSTVLAKGEQLPTIIPVAASEGAFTITEASNGQQVSAQEGQILILTLDVHPSTGFMWEFISLDDAFLSIIDRRFEAESQLVGAPGKEIIRLQILREGMTSLKMAYKRPWDTSRPPAKTLSITLTIGGRIPQIPVDESHPTVTPVALQAPSSIHGSSFQYHTGDPGRGSVRIDLQHPPGTVSSSAVNLPSAFDWRSLGAVTPVKDQGGCGCCWAFATVGVMEAALKIWGGVEADLSEQYLVAHNEHGWGCGGGTHAHDYHIFEKPLGEREAGAVRESECPYTATDDKCPGPQPMRHPYALDGWAYVPRTIRGIKEAIYRYGPISTYVCVGPAFSSYGGGVFETDEADYCSGGINHAVVLVGWDDTQGANGVWILRNSWDTWWGESGYMRIGYGISGVGISNAYVTYDGTPLDLLSQIGGSTGAVNIQYPYAYVGFGSRLAVLNVSDPANPTPEGSGELIRGRVNSIYVRGSDAYVACDWPAGLRIFDISNPADPQPIGGLSDLDSTLDVVISGSLAFVAQGSVDILDVSDPADPTAIGSVDTPGYPQGIAISGDYAYVADGSAGLTVLDASDPTAPCVVTSLDVPGEATDVALGGDYAHVAATSGGLRIIDVSVPSDPIEISHIVMPGYVYGVAVDATHAYVAEWQGGLRIIDVTNPALPEEIGYYDAHVSARTVAANGNQAYIADVDCGLIVINVADPTAPYEEGAYEPLAQAYDTLVAGDLAYVAAYKQGIQILNIASPASPAQVGVYDTPGIARALDMSDSYLYVADGRHLRVLDLNDPIHPTEVGAVYSSPCYDVDVEGHYAYIAAHSSGLRILSVSDPASPVEVGTFDTSGYATRVVVVGHYAYVADQPVWNGSTYTGGGLYIIDVSNPSTPIIAAFYDTPARTVDVAVEGSYAYVVDDELWTEDEGVYGGLYVLNVSNPYSPTEVTSMPISSASTIDVKESTVYVGDTTGTITVIGVNSANEATLHGSMYLGGGIESIAISDGYAWVGPRDCGLYGLRLLRDRVTAYIPPGGGGFCSKAEVAAFSFRGGTFAQETAVTYRQLCEDPQVVGMTGVGRTYLLEAVSHTSSQPVSPSNPYTSVISYTSGLTNEETLALYAWDGKRWVKEPTSRVNQAQHRLSANPDNIGMFSVQLTTGYSIYIPVVLRNS